MDGEINEDGPSVDPEEEQQPEEGQEPGEGQQDEEANMSVGTVLFGTTEEGEWDPEILEVVKAEYEKITAPNATMLRMLLEGALDAPVAMPAEEIKEMLREEGVIPKNLDKDTEVYGEMFWRILETLIIIKKLMNSGEDKKAKYESFFIALCVSMVALVAAYLKSEQGKDDGIEFRIPTIESFL
jgi:hypothetical protein